MMAACPAAIEESAGQAAIIGLVEGGGEMDGRNNVARSAFRLAAGMDGTGFNLHQG
jgi:hypothetical protein